MTEPASELPTETEDTAPAVARGGVRRFLLDVVAMLLLLSGIGVLLVYGVAIWLDGDVSAVKGVWMRVAAFVFFFRVFQYHVAGAVLVVGLLAMLIRYRKVGAFNLLLALLMAWPLLRAYLPKWPPPVTGKTLKVYSANLFTVNRQADAMLRSIKAEDPDVIVLLEVTSWSYDLMMREFGKTHPYQHRPHYNAGGMVISRVPFREDPPVVTLKGNHTRVPLVFELDGKELAVYPVHLLSPGKLSLIAQHREQIREFLEIERAEHRPMVIVGDCNMTPRTPNFGALREVGFRSTYELAGFGSCNTWGPRWWPKLYKLPGIQIDQMLIQPPLTAKWHKVGQDTGSDHRPIVAEIGFDEPK